MSEICFTDTETGGLTTDTSLLTAAFLSPETGNMLELFLLHDIYHVSAPAIAVNHWNVAGHEDKKNKEDFQHVVTPQTGLSKLKKFVKDNFKEKPILGAWNPIHDRNFLLDGLFAGNKALIDETFDYHSCDVASIAFACKEAGLLNVEKVRLGVVAEYFGISSEYPAHTAIGDTIVLYGVYEELLNSMML